MRMLTLLIILMILNIFGKGKAEETHSGPVTYLEYSKSGMRSRFEYIFQQNADGTCTLFFKRGYRDTPPMQTEVPAETAEELWKIVKDEKMLKYKDSYTPPMRVLDGYMWHLGVHFAQGEHLYSGGDNAVPDGGKGIDRLVKYLETLWDTHAPKITKLVYRENQCMAYPTAYYMVTRDENGEYWLTNASNRPESEAQKIKVDKWFMEDLMDIMAGEGVMTYKNSYEPEMEVFDGTSWSLEINLSNHKGLYSSGHNAWPAGYGLKRMEDLFERTWTRKQEQAVESPLSK